MTRENRFMDYLNRILDLRKRVQTLEKRGDYLRAQASGCSSVRAFRCGNRDESLQEKRILELVDNNSMLKETLDELLLRESEAEKLILKLPDQRMRMILQDRFLTGMLWEDVSQVQFTSVRNLNLICRKAMKKLDKDYRALVLEKEGRIIE